MYANLAYFRVLLELLGVYVALDKVDLYLLFTSHGTIACMGIIVRLIVNIDSSKDLPCLCQKIV